MWKHLFIAAGHGEFALTPALSPEERVRGEACGPVRSHNRVRQRSERGEAGQSGEVGFRVPSPGGEGQGEGGPFLPTTMKRCARCIVTADALHCQKNIAREIQEADAEYVLALKGNQGTAFAEVKAFLDDAIQRKEPHLVTLETTDQEHGRLEVRRYWQTQKLE